MRDDSHHDEAALADPLGATDLLPKDWASWVVTASIAILVYLITSFGLFSSGASWQIAAFTGAAAGLASASFAQAGIVTFLVLLPTALIWPPWYVSLAGRGPNLGAAAFIAIVAAASCAGTAFAKGVIEERAPRARIALSLALLIWVLVALWLTPMTLNRLGNPQNPPLVERLRVVPQPGQYMTDDAAYLRMFYLTHQGMPYYDAVRDAWKGDLAWRSLPWGYVSYRLPTIFWLWKILPADGAALVPALLVFASLAVAAAYLIALQLAGSDLAPLAAAAVAAYYLYPAMTLYVTYVDPWAMAIALCGIALFVRAVVTSRTGWLWAAAAACALAALTREILVYVIVFALLSALAVPKRSRWTEAAPWLAALGAFVSGYAAHVIAIAGAVSPNSTLSTWFRGSPRYLWVALQLTMEFMNGRPWLLPLLVLLGVAGAFASKRLAGDRLALFAGACTVIPLGALMFVGNPGVTVQGRMFNYWGMLVIPIALSFAPVAAMLLPGLSPAPEAAGGLVGDSVREPSGS